MVGSVGGYIDQEPYSCKGCKFRAVSNLPRWQLPSNPPPTDSRVTQVPYRQHKLGFEGHTEVIKNG